MLVALVVDVATALWSIVQRCSRAKWLLLSIRKITAVLLACYDTAASCSECMCAVVSLQSNKWKNVEFYMNKIESAPRGW